MLRERFFLSLIFFFSGAASLIYQVVWQRLLTTFYGVENLSVTLIVSVFMLGLGIGSLIGGTLAERIKNKLLAYFYIEIGLGLFGLLSLPFIQFIGKTTAGSPYLLTFFYLFVLLCIPTILMGMTLPLLTKIFNGIVNNFLKSISHLYFINTLGAAFGALAASYLIISFLGLDYGVYIAAGINFILGVSIFLAVSGKKESTENAIDQENHEGTAIAQLLPIQLIYLLVTVTGFLAIGYEITWIRIISLLVKASPYAFSSVLVVYLLGIALGSYTMERVISGRKDINRKRLFFLLQFGIGASVLLIFSLFYHGIEHSFLKKFADLSFNQPLHPPVKVPPFNSFKVLIADVVFPLFDLFIWPAVLFGIPALLMGASFPLITSLGLHSKDREGETVGKIYFFNILGNVAGGIITGFFFLEYLGTERTLIIFSISGLLIGLISVLSSSKKTQATLASGFLIMIAIAYFAFPKSGELYAAIMPDSLYPDQQVTFHEGKDAVVHTLTGDGKLRTYINGVAHGERPNLAYDYETIKALSHLDSAKSVLIIGYGTGNIADMLVNHSDDFEVTLVELSHSVIVNSRKIDFLSKTLDDPGLKLVINDGRKYMLACDQKFDLILMDPLRSTTAYSNNLNSKEYFELLAGRLKPGGVGLVWMNEHRVIPKTLATVFGHVKKYGYFALASNSELVHHPEKEREFMSGYSGEPFKALIALEKKYGNATFNRAEILKLSEIYPINTDLRPVSEYYLGLPRLRKAEKVQIEAESN